MVAKQNTREYLYKVAKAYYNDNLTQQQIGDRFGLSRVTVSRMLQRARQDKVVQITINTPETSNAEMERQIEQRYKLKETVIVTCSDSSPPVVISEIGSVAASYLIQTLKGDEVLAISWGHTLLSVVNALPSVNYPDLKVVQLTGGLGELEAKTHGAELARRTAQALGGTLRLLQAPGIVKNKGVRDALVNDPQVSGTLELATNADVALVGIGLFDPTSTLLGSNQLSAKEIEDLKKHKAVGDIALKFFNKDGKKVKSLIDERIVGLSFSTIRKINRIIGVAGSKDKFPVIKAALNSGLIDVLITDNETGQMLLK